jgi:putative transposase
MIFTKTFKFRLRPNREQASSCAQFAGGARWIFNRGLEQRNKLWQEEKRSISLIDQNNELVLLKNEEKTSWLKEIHSQVLQQALHDLNESFNHFFRRVKNKQMPGYPRFRCKGEDDSFRYPQGVKLKRDHVWLPKMGWVRFRKSREIEGKVKQTTVIRESNYWYVCLTCEIEKHRENPESGGGIIGIDVGLQHFATIATETGTEEIKSPHFLKKRLVKIKYLSRQLSKKEKKSSNRLKAKQALNTEHGRIKNQRRDFQHKLSTQLVKSHGKIVIESLAIKELLEKEPRYRARAISDAGWRGFLQMLKYKSEEQGKELLEVGRYFPSTKQCFRCKTKNEISLEQREYSCHCGHRVHRDHNAALNLRAAGMSV